MPRIAAFAALVAGGLIVSLAIAFTDVRAFGPAPVAPVALISPTLAATPSPDPTPAAIPTPLPTRVPTPPPPTHPSWAPLAAQISSLVTQSGAQAAVQLIELAEPVPSRWSLNPDQQFDAASDYKLVALMAEAERIATAKADPKGLVCFQDGDHEEGWFDDYAPGACFTRTQLAIRAGHYSDNTAGHMLVRDLGGSEALDAYAARNGATGSKLFDSNLTTAHDLAVLWAAESAGRLGGPRAQTWLYPVLTGTRYEAGIPAGLKGATVIHKTGAQDLEVNDAALVRGGHGGAYTLVVLTDGLGGDAAWSLIAQISTVVARYEATR